MSDNDILFPFDFSPQSQHAAPFVAAFANRLGAKVTLLTVVPPVWTVPPPMMMGALLTAPADTKSRLDGALSQELAGVAVERVVAEGDPAVKIVEWAHGHATGLIMMPTHGFGVFRRLLIGSVTSKVLHDAECPVWTAAHACKQRTQVVPRTILCALDGTPQSAALLKWAGEFSRRMGASLQLLHVLRPISDWLALEAERLLQEEVRQEARARLELIQEEAGVDAPLRVAVGEIAEVVTEEARQEDADLLIIGRGTLQATLGRLRTHAYAIIQRSPCPVLSA